MTRSARAFTFPSTKAQIKRLIAAARETRCAKLWWLAVDGTKIEISLTEESAEPANEDNPWDKWGQA